MEHIESLGTDPHKCSQLSFYKGLSKHDGAKIIFFQKMMLKQLGRNINMQKINLDTDLLPFTEINAK